MSDPVNHPDHYTSHASGIEVIQITEHMNFNLGNAVKYILRSDLKGKQIEDLQKAAWYVNREIDRLQRDRVQPVEVENYHKLIRVDNPMTGITYVKEG